MLGSEDLGDGLKAVFVLENGFSPDTGALGNGGRLFGRNAYVGLNSDQLGELKLGRTLNLAFSWLPSIASPFGLAMGRNTVGSTFGFDDDSFGNGRVDNSVYYTSPSMGGLQAAGGYSFNIGTPLPGANIVNEAAGSKNNNRMLDLGARYTGGPVQAGVSYMRTDVAASATSQADPSAITVGASYDFRLLKVHVGYSRLRNTQTEPSGRALSNPGWLTAWRNDDQAYSAGISAPLGRGTIAGRSRAQAIYRQATPSVLPH
ncbi:MULTISPECIES: porin [unclassified Pigmentiphaga]|uniref:porin n=1 Tax=unclassified Pigmentiphaga TaxID=2626614 RepID=UPI000B414C74|nr:MULTISPECIES: porin [unclassified Pigmentiphaga]OVZ66431.1 hypothetical protein CDO46_00695 [Pigmentiphaga sp. NML030171]